MIDESDVYRIGRIGKPHGVTGELTFMFDDDIFDRTDADYLLVSVDGLPVPFFIDDYRFRSDHTALLRLEGIDSHERARELTNCDVLFPRRLADADGQTTRPASLVGYTMVDAADGTVIGSVTAVDDTTANTLLVVGSLLVPAADEYIQHIDTRQRRLTVSLPDGLLEL